MISNWPQVRLDKTPAITGFFETVSRSESTELQRKRLSREPIWPACRAPQCRGWPRNAAKPTPFLTLKSELPAVCYGEWRRERNWEPTLSRQAIAIQGTQAS